MPISMGTYLQPEHHWECPNCDQKCVSHGAQPHTPMHECPGLKHLMAPMVAAGTKCKVETKVREDYVGKDDVTYDEEGRPVSAVETTRDEGNDLAVYAPCAHSGGGAD